MGNRRQAQRPSRPVRSYVLRQGRLTPAQKSALERLWPRYGIASGNGELNVDELFERPAPLIVEIGFGNGRALAAMAQADPALNYLGIEVHRPGVGHLLRLLEEKSIDNVRVVCEDAVEFIGRRIPEFSLAGVRIWFPDPWPKKRHHKRRLIQPDFVELLARKMAPGAILHLATDWMPYAEQMLEVLHAAPGFHNLSETGDYCARPPWRPRTRFERRGERLGHETRDLLFRRIEREVEHREEGSS